MLFWRYSHSVLFLSDPVLSRKRAVSLAVLPLAPLHSPSMLPHPHSLFQFESQAREAVQKLPWVSSVALRMTAQPPRPLIPDTLPLGLQRVANVIAVSSCKVIPVVYVTDP